jgi:hypothetical protein
MPNAGTIDRVIRLLIGIGLLSLVYVGPQTPLGLLGIVPIGTALSGWCPLYGLLRIRTRRAQPGR